MPERARGYEVAVLGAGCAGAAVAYALAPRRIASVVVDAAGPGRAFPVPAAAPVQSGTPADIMFALRGAERLPELQDAIGSFGYRRTGGMVVALGDAEEELSRGRAAEAAAAGLPLRWLSREETLRREPGVTDRVAGAVYCAFDGVADAGALARRLLGAAMRFGTVAHLDCGFVGVTRQNGGFRIRAGRDEVVARRIVVASAGLLHTTARQLGLTLPVRARRRRICLTDRLVPLLRHTVNGIRQEPSGELVLDSSAVDGDHSPTDVRSTVDEFRRIATAAAQVVSGIEHAQILHAPVTVCQEAADGRPVVGRTDDDLYVAIAAADHALTQSPLIGEAIAEAVARSRSPDSMEPWSPARFALAAAWAGTGVQDSPNSS
ncbi:MAG TPA: FAD-dependent oxidoreductase [bacterium]|nr:FAD-dependent oxidoreductase [bacterium]